MAVRTSLCKASSLAKRCLPRFSLIIRLIRSHPCMLRTKMNTNEKVETMEPPAKNPAVAIAGMPANIIILNIIADSLVIRLRTTELHIVP